MMEQNNDDYDNRDVEGTRRFGDYELVKPIGKGKFAIVYRAKHVHNNDVVALKRINVDMIDNKTRDKCLKEVNLLQSLDHPNIIRYLDSFITENDLVIIVEWAAAGDLKRQLRKQAEKNIGFDERLIWKYFSQICDAIQHMHERRILHRDLKPANIFLTLDGTIKVGDLGLSRELSEHTIQAHSKVGTPLYMSPEVLQGNGYDFKSDIWSLGCLLYELAMLKSPFKSEGLKLYALFQKISQGDYQAVPDTYSQGLRDLTHSLLQTKPEDRPDISQICEIARNMRTSTQDAYLKEKNRLKRQASNESIEEGKPSPQPSKNNKTSTSSSRRNSGVYETKTDIHSPQPMISPYDDDDGKDVKSLSHRRDDHDVKQQQLSYQQQLPFARYQEEKSSNQSPSPRHVDSSVSPHPPSATRQTPQSYRRMKPQPTSSSTAVTAAMIKSPMQIDTSNNNNHLIRMDDTNMDSPIEVPRAPKRSPNDSQQVSSEKIQRLSSAIPIMDALYTKLILLDYTKYDTKLLPMHFAVDLTAYASRGISGAGQGYIKQQYCKFVDVALWLVARIISCNDNIYKNKALKAKLDGIQPDRDAPAMVCKQLLTLAQDAGVSPEDVEVSPTMLIPGHGDKVCSFLLALTENVMKLENYKLKPLIYADHTLNSVIDDVDEEHDDEDVLEESEGQSKPANDVADEDNISHSNIISGDYTKATKTPFIEPVLWIAEYERVAPLLMKNTQTNMIGSHGWLSHINNISSYTSSMITPDGGKMSETSSKSIIASLCMLTKDLDHTLTNVKRSESRLNAIVTISSRIGEYTGLKQMLDEKSGAIKILSKSVDVKTEKLAEVSSFYAAIRDEYESRSSDDALTSNTRLLRLKESLITIKNDVRGMELGIGLIMNQLLQRRQEIARHQLVNRLKKKKHKKTSHNHRYKEHDDDEHDR